MSRVKHAISGASPRTANIRPHMSRWQKIWTDRQREAIHYAYFTHRITNMAQLGRLARAGELTFEGDDMPAFPIPDASVRDIINAEKRRRAGRLTTQLARQPPGDSVEALRRRLVSMLDHETTRLEKQQQAKRTAPLDVTHFAKLTRALKELASLPAPGTGKQGPGRPSQPPEDHGAPNTAETLAGSLVAALEANPTPRAPTADQDNPHHTENTQPATSPNHDHTNSQPNTETTAQNDDSGLYQTGTSAGFATTGVSVVQVR